MHLLPKSLNSLSWSAHAESFIKIIFKPNFYQCRPLSRCPAVKIVQGSTMGHHGLRIGLLINGIKAAIGATQLQEIVECINNRYFICLGRVNRTGSR